MSIHQAQQIDPFSLSYCNPCQPIFPSSPTHAASSAMPQERSLTVVLGPFGYPLCSGHTSTLLVVIIRDAGTHAHRKVDLQLYMLSDQTFNVRMRPRKLPLPTATPHFPLPNLKTVFHDAIYGVLVYFSHIQATPLHHAS